MCKTNPISPGRGRPPEEIVQNKAEPGGTGVCGKRRLSCGAWLGRGVNRAEQTQLPGRGPRDCGLRIGDCGLKEAARDGVRAKRTQLPGRGPRDCGLWIGDGGLRDAGRGGVPEAKCAKQTQLAKGRNGRKHGSLKRLWTCCRTVASEKQTQFAAGGADACGRGTRRTGTRRRREGVRCTPYGASDVTTNVRNEPNCGAGGPGLRIGDCGLRISD
jgi:hypothetical protein